MCMTRRWSRHEDEALLRGSYQLGYLPHKLPAIVEDILQDPAFGFTVKVAQDPVEAWKALHTPPAPPPPQPPPTAAAADGTTNAAPAAGNTGSSSTPAAPQYSKEQVQMLANAQLRRKNMITAALEAGRSDGMHFMVPRDWRKFIVACVARLKKVRGGMDTASLVTCVILGRSTTMQ